MPDVSESEGVGVAPDVDVPLTIQDLRDKHDVALAGYGKNQEIRFLAD